jgi:hypothetical protein
MQDQSARKADQARALLHTAAGREPSHTAAFEEHGRRIGALMVASGFGEPMEATKLCDKADDDRRDACGMH